MKKFLLCFSLCILFFSCRKDSSGYKEDLTNNLEDFNYLLKYIEKNYNNEFINRKGDNIIIFTDCDFESINYSTIVCNSKYVLEKMNDLNITKISFEKYSENCSSNYGFNQVNFKLEKNALESSVYYRYEYCGTSKVYKSNTIEYYPIDKNWSIFIDSNAP